MTPFAFANPYAQADVSQSAAAQQLAQYAPAFQNGLSSLLNAWRPPAALTPHWVGRLPDDVQ